MRLASLAFGVVLLGGCATLFSGKDPVEIPTVSTPDGADVYLDGNRLGTTPVNVLVERKHPHTLVFQKTGYKDASCVLTANVGAGWVVLDVLGGIIPVVIDAVTGDWQKVSGNCNMKMVPTEAASGE